MIAKPRRLRGVLTAVVAAAWVTALVLTHLPPEDVQTFGASDTTLHAVGYAGLGSLLWLTLAAWGVGASRRALVVLIALAAYGAVDELTQPWFRRTAELGDWLTDVAGAIVATVFWTVAARMRRSRTARLPHRP